MPYFRVLYFYLCYRGVGEREFLSPLLQTLGLLNYSLFERWGAGVETQKNVRGEIGGWGRVPFNETYAPSLSTIYDGA